MHKIMFKKKTWKVEYYEYNLTNRIEKMFYTKFAALHYGKYINNRFGFRTIIRNVGE